MQQLCSEVRLLVSYTVFLEKKFLLGTFCFGCFTKSCPYVFRDQHQDKKYLCIVLLLIRRV